MQPELPSRLQLEPAIDFRGVVALIGDARVEIVITRPTTPRTLAADLERAAELAPKGTKGLVRALRQSAVFQRLANPNPL